MPVRVRRTLLSSLARIVDRYDKNVALRALLTALPREVYLRPMGRVVPVQNREGAARLIDDAMRRLNSGSEFYRPASDARPRLARETLRHIVSASTADDSTSVDAGFEAMRWLASAADAFDDLPLSEWSSVRVGPFRPAVDQRALPPLGSLILTHPVACLRQPTLHQAVILIAEQGSMAVEGEARSGVMGIVVNKPSRITLKQLLQATGDSTDGPLGVLGECPVYLGGDVMQDRLLLLHPHSWLERSDRLCEGVYISTDAEAVSQAVRDGRAEAASFKVFVGHAGWAAEQLQVECERGVWFTTMSHPEAVRDLVVDTHCLLDNDMANASAAPQLRPMSTALGQNPPQFLQSAGQSVYCSVLSQLGPEYAELCQLALDADVLLEHLQATVERHHDWLMANIVVHDPDSGGEGGQRPR